MVPGELNGEHCLLKIVREIEDKFGVKTYETIAPVLLDYNCRNVMWREISSDEKDSDKNTCNLNTTLNTVYYRILQFFGCMKDPTATQFVNKVSMEVDRAKME
jgi:hypothetical protein